VDRLERVFTHLNDSQPLEGLSDIKEDEESRSHIGSASSESVISHSSTNNTLFTLPFQPNQKTEQLLLELQKENMKLHYIKEMHEEKIHDLTQQLLVVETLLDTSFREDSDSEREN